MTPVARVRRARLRCAGRALIRRSLYETTFDNRRGNITSHPSYLLRVPDPTERAAATAAFRTDLARIRDLAA